ncbi:MAG: RtcB family protein [Paludibacteraceae bacterium]|nr:RtcB family protein [Paludibacteraceae bacterium]
MKTNKRSMATPSYYVGGKGNEDSLCSCSHGSGRKMSRKQAKETFSKKEMHDFLEAAGVELLAGGIDECPMAYKDVAGVMEAQKDLVGICGTFRPKIVMMCDEPDND